jgi:hypothetical protein
LFSVHSDYFIIYRLFVEWLDVTGHKKETVSSGVAEVMYFCLQLGGKMITESLNVSFNSLFNK